jgi:hypothetical protein
VYTWLDPQRTRYGFGYGSPCSLAGLIHALKDDIVSASGSGAMPAQGHSGHPHRPIGVGAVSSSNIRPSGRSLTSYFYINKLPRLGKGGAQLAAHRPMLSLELGTLRLAYSFAQAVSTLVDSSWRGDDGGKENCCSY